MSSFIQRKMDNYHRRQWSFSSFFNFKNLESIPVPDGKSERELSDPQRVDLFDLARAIDGTGCSPANTGDYHGQGGQQHGRGLCVLTGFRSTAHESRSIAETMKRREMVRV